MFNKFFKDVNKRQAISWALYDFANSSYFLIVVSFIFSIYFKEVIAHSNRDFWGEFAVSISIFLGGITTPLVGAISDKYQQKKNKLIIYQPFFSNLATNSSRSTSLTLSTINSGLLKNLFILTFPEKTISFPKRSSR